MNALTSGTIMKPASIAITPLLIGDCKITGKEGLIIIFKIIIPAPNMKFAQTEAFVTHFPYKLYKNGAKNAPAKAPQEIHILSQSEKDFKSKSLHHFKYTVNFLNNFIQIQP